MIYYRFYILFPIILGRTQLFDRWYRPFSLFLLFGFNVICAVCCAIHLRHVSERGRHRSRECLNDKLSQALKKTRVGQANSNFSEQVRLLIREIETNELGVFAPWSKQPQFRALTLPLGGAGLVRLLDYLI